MQKNMKTTAIIAIASLLAIVMGTLAVFAATGEGGLLDWRDPEYHDKHQEEMNPQESDGPITFQIRTESRGDVPILETSNQTFIKHQDRIHELVNSGEWEELEQYGSLTVEAEAIMTGEGTEQFLDEEVVDPAQ